MSKGKGFVTIRIIVQDGKEIHLSVIVPHKTGFYYEFPEPIELEDGVKLEAITVSAKVSSRAERSFKSTGRVLNMDESKGAFGSKFADKFLGGEEIEQKEPKPDHEHKAVNTTIKAFQSCARPQDCEPRAHGDMATHETCSCRMTKVTNKNRGYEEEGTWTRWVAEQFPRVK